MTDLGSYRVQSQALRTHAEFWSAKAGQADRAQTGIQPAVGRGDDLGFLAGMFGIADHYNQWTSDMYAALGDASATFTYIYTALNSCANGYDGTASTVAMTMDALDPLNNVR